MVEITLVERDGIAMVLKREREREETKRAHVAWMETRSLLGVQLALAGAYRTIVDSFAR